MQHIGEIIMFSHIQQLTRFAHQRDLQSAEYEIRRKQAAASRLANFISRLGNILEIAAEKTEKSLERVIRKPEPSDQSPLMQDRIFKAARSDMPSLPSLASFEGYRDMLVNKIRRY
jgi:hypothetical protein